MFNNECRQLVHVNTLHVQQTHLPKQMLGSKCCHLHCLDRTIQLCWWPIHSFVFFSFLRRNSERISFLFVTIQGKLTSLLSKHMRVWADELNSAILWRSLHVVFCIDTVKRAHSTWMTLKLVHEWVISLLIELINSQLLQPWLSLNNCYKYLRKIIIRPLKCYAFSLRFTERPTYFSKTECQAVTACALCYAHLQLIRQIIIENHALITLLISSNNLLLTPYRHRL